MEKNVVLIDLDKYEQLIKEVENLKQKNKELEHLYLEEKTNNVLVKDTITNMIYKDYEWQLKQIVKDKNEDNTYYKRQIGEAFNKYGFISQDFINGQLEIMLDKYEENEGEDKDEK